MSALGGLLVALALLFGGGGATALAAQDALPDDALYGVKLATEDLQFGLTSDPAQQVALLEDWADRRIREMGQLAQAGEEIPLETALRLQTQLMEALRVAAQLQDLDLTPTLLRLQTRLETRLRTMEQLRTADPNGATLRTAQQAMIRAHSEIQGALEDPAAFRTRYGAGRPADAPEQPEVVPGQPPVSTPGAGGQGNGEGQNPDAGQGAGSQGGYGPDDGTCTCTPQADGSQRCTPACLQYAQGTGSQNGYGAGTANCQCTAQPDGMLLCSSACEPILYLWSTPGPHGYGPGPGGK